MAKTPIAEFTFEESGLDTTVRIEVLDAFSVKDSLKEIGFHWEVDKAAWVRTDTFLSDTEVDKFTKELQQKLSDLGCELA